jgi:hypothetical protein
LLVLALPPTAGAAPWLRLGFSDDTLKWMSKPNGYVWAQKQLGAPFTRITIPWKRGQVAPPPVVRTYLGRAVDAHALSQKVVLAIYNTADEAPTDPVSRNQYCRYVLATFKLAPDTAAIVIWNEANSPRYWPSSAGAASYETLLARCYDLVHSFRPLANVIDSTASHYDPGGFLRALGAAYRASGRTRPIVDTFGHNPYPEFAAEDPWARHDDGTIGEGDYDTLLASLQEAFGGTAQRVPSAEWARLWYLEDGFQTSVPRALSPLYHGLENDVSVLDPVGPRSQASQLAAAIALAYCQPATSAFFNFMLVDERRLVGWQSGLMYANGVRKPSFDAYREVAAAVANHTIDCAQVEGAPGT